MSKLTKQKIEELQQAVDYVCHVYGIGFTPGDGCATRSNWDVTFDSDVEDLIVSYGECIDAESYTDASDALAKCNKAMRRPMAIKKLVNTKLDIKSNPNQMLTAAALKKTDKMVNKVLQR